MKQHKLLLMPSSNKINVGDINGWRRLKPIKIKSKGIKLNENN